MPPIKITAAESLVMEALWRRSPRSAEEMTAELGEANAWSLATVRTLAGRLVKKGALATELDGRRYLFRPLVERADYLQAESEGLIDRLFGGRVGPFVTQFSERRKLSAEDVAELKRLIADLEDGQ